MKVYIAVPTYGVGVDPEIYKNHMLLIASSDGLIKNLGITINELIHNARNKLVQEVLDDEYVNLEEDYIFWLDQDIIVGPGTLKKLLSHNKDIVTGLYFQKCPPFYPLIMLRKPGQEKVSRGLHDYLHAYPEGLHKVDAIGFGCVVTKVSVFNRIPKPWFEWTKDSGEDIDFCIKAKDYNIDIWYDSEICCGHMGERVVFTHDDFQSLREGKLIRRT